MKKWNEIFRRRGKRKFLTGWQIGDTKLGFYTSFYGGNKARQFILREDGVPVGEVKFGLD
jgi:hypothetical protein